MRRRRVGDDLGKRCLARAGRPIEYKTAQLVRLNRAAQESTRPHNRFLADELIECARPHARGQGGVGVNAFVASRFKQIAGWLAALCVAHHERIYLALADVLGLASGRCAVIYLLTETRTLWAKRSCG